MLNFSVCLGERKSTGGLDPWKTCFW